MMFVDEISLTESRASGEVKQTSLTVTGEVEKAWLLEGEVIATEVDETTLTEGQVCSEVEETWLLEGEVIATEVDETTLTEGHPQLRPRPH